MLDLGVCHIYFHPEVPLKQMVNDFEYLGEIALRAAAPYMYTSTQTTRCSGKIQRSYKLYFGSGPYEGLVSPKQWFSTLAAHRITWEGEEALIPNSHSQ